MIHRSLADLGRVIGLLTIGVALMRFSPAVALWAGQAELSIAGTSIGWGFVVAAASHVMRRILFPGVDLRKVMWQAIADKQAGHVVIGICLVLAAFVLGGNNVKAAELPPGAVKYLPALQVEQRLHWEEADLPTLSAQVEQETCISLRHSKCWTPYAELKTAREWGVGLGQITRTANMDALTELVLRHPRELAGWSWNSPLLYDASLQARGLVLKNRDNWQSISGAATLADRWAMTLVAYNGGPGRVRSNRKLCEGTRGCDASRWFGHAENTTTLIRKKLPGYGKSFAEVVYEYPRLILLERRARYV